MGVGKSADWIAGIGAAKRAEAGEQEEDAGCPGCANGG